MGEMVRLGRFCMRLLSTWIYLPIEGEGDQDEPGSPSGTRCGRRPWIAQPGSCAPSGETADGPAGRMSGHSRRIDSPYGGQGGRTVKTNPPHIHATMKPFPLSGPEFHLPEQRRGRRTGALSPGSASGSASKSARMMYAPRGARVCTFSSSCIARVGTHTCRAPRAQPHTPRASSRVCHAPSRVRARDDAGTRACAARRSPRRWERSGRECQVSPRDGATGAGRAGGRGRHRRLTDARERAECLAHAPQALHERGRAPRRRGLVLVLAEEDRGYFLRTMHLRSCQRRARVPRGGAGRESAGGVRETLRPEACLRTRRLQDARVPGGEGWVDAALRWG
jgi:hypothetical protein